MDNEQDDIKIILELLSLMDMYKDFILNVLDSNNSDHKLIQKDILLKAITKFTDTNKIFFEKKNDLKNRLNKLTDKNITEINKILDSLLGVSPQMPKELMIKLFPNIEDKHTLFIYFMRYLKKITNSEHPKQEFENLKKKSISFTNDQDLKLFFEKELQDKTTMSWIDATPGTKRIPVTTGILSLLAKKKLLKSFINYGSKLDAASENNELSKMTGFLSTFQKFYLDQREIDINFKSTNGENLVELIIKKDIKEKLHLQIKDFYGLKCYEKYGDSISFSDRGNKITRTICWENIIKLFDFHGITKENVKDLTDEVINKDLCIKANKTAMDMLKQFFVKQYINDNPNEDIISIFNDLNSAKLMAAMSKKGFVVYGSAIKNLDQLNTDDTEERVIFRKEYIDILLKPQEQSQSSAIFYDAESQPDDEEDIQSKESPNQQMIKTPTIILPPNGFVWSNPRARTDGNCQFDSLALNYINFERLEMSENNMKRISQKIQDEIREYLLNNYNVDELDKQSIDEINLFLEKTPQEGGWGNEATLQAYVNISRNNIDVHLPNEGLIQITSLSGESNNTYHLYLNNPGTPYGHYDAIFPQNFQTPQGSIPMNLDFGKKSKSVKINLILKSVDMDIHFLKSMK